MNFPKKWCKFLSLIMLGVFCVSNMSYAHEFGPNSSYRWNNISNMPVNADYIQDIPAYMFDTAIFDWNSKTGRKNFYKTSISNSYIDFVDPINSEWGWGPFIVAVTLLKNSSNLWNIPCRYGSGGFTSGTAIRAVIEINPDTSLYSKIGTKNYLIRHELGHTLGLGHVPVDGSIASIMFPDTSSQWVAVQQHDVDDVNAFY